jgi:hypothetical protein
VDLHAKNTEDHHHTVPHHLLSIERHHHTLMDLPTPVITTMELHQWDRHMHETNVGITTSGKTTTIIIQTEGDRHKTITNTIHDKITRTEVMPDINTLLHHTDEMIVEPGVEDMDVMVEDIIS